MFLDKVVQWANFTRVGTEVTSNMFVESFNSILKRGYLKGRAGKRLDFLIGTLLEEVCPSYKDKYVKQTIKPMVKDSYRTLQMHKKHREAMAMDVDTVSVVEYG